MIVITFFITPKKRIFRSLLNIFEVVAILFFVQSIVRINWYDMYIVSSASMERTFFKGDIIIIKKNQKEYERNDVLLFRSNWNNRVYLVKRCIGLPGDTLSIRQDTVFCNGVQLSFLPNYQWSYYLPDNIELEKIAKIIYRTFKKNNVENSDNNLVYLTLNEKDLIQQLLSINLVRATKLKEVEPHVYSCISDIATNRDNIPYIYIPKKGDTIALKKENMWWYRKIVSKENPDIVFNDNEFYLNNTKITSYILKQDYYYMMGDNRHASQDSRYWGFIPRQNIIGRYR